MYEVIGIYQYYKSQVFFNNVKMRIYLLLEMIDRNYL